MIYYKSDVTFVLAYYYCVSVSLPLKIMAKSGRKYNYGQYINQFSPNTIKVIREFERIQKKICRHKMSIMFNEICINEEMLPQYTYFKLLNNKQYILLNIYNVAISNIQYKKNYIPSNQQQVFLSIKFNVLFLSFYIIQNFREA